MAAGMVMWRAVRAGTLQARAFSSAATSITDQMIGYALQQGKAKRYDAAVDVLKSGLSMQPGGKGTDAARLLLAQASLEWDRDRWSAALTCTDQVQEALQGTSTSGTGGGSGSGQEDPDLLRLTGGKLAVSIHLLQGNDAAARAACEACASTNTTSSSLAARQASLSLQLSTAHALCDVPGAEAAARLLTEARETGSNAGQGEKGWPEVAALTALADWNAAGVKEEVVTMYNSAIQAAQETTQAPQSECSFINHEMGAAAHLGLSQVYVRAEQWDEAEDALGKALTEAERVSGELHPRIAPALLLLGSVYARSARVTFAEGLNRQVATLLKVDLNKDPAHLPSTAHPSLIAVLAWRTHQLMTALPKRGHEATAWANLAHAAWATSGPLKQQGTIESFLGESGMLTGKGNKGKGLLVSLTSRRALPLHV